MIEIQIVNRPSSYEVTVYRDGQRLEGCCATYRTALRKWHPHPDEAVALARKYEALAQETGEGTKHSYPEH